MSTAYHLALLQPAYIDAVLDGTKNVEARLSKVRTPPYEGVRLGDMIYLREVGGEIRATAMVAGVRSFAGLTPRDVDALRIEYGEDVRAPRAFWDERRDARYATFISLEQIREQEGGLDWRCRVPQGSRSGWHMLDGPLSPLGPMPLRPTG